MSPVICKFMPSTGRDACIDKRSLSHPGGTSHMGHKVPCLQWLCSESQQVWGQSPRYSYNKSLHWLIYYCGLVHVIISLCWIIDSSRISFSGCTVVAQKLLFHQLGMSGFIDVTGCWSLSLSLPELKLNSFWDQNISVFCSLVFIICSLNFRTNLIF